jgi:hypothetical protein
MQGGVQAALVRHRNWVVMSVLVVASVIVVLVAGRQKGNSTSVRVRFGASLHAPATAAINLTNGWIATSGSEQIAVYAGSQAHHSRNGLLIVSRSTARKKGVRTVTMLAGSGTLTLLRPPRFSSEEIASTATLRFLTANGNTGTLNLSNNRVTR